MQKADLQKQIGPNRAVVVSIHDVSPATRRQTESILSDLSECGIGRISLLVIPDHHHRGRVQDDPEFVQWLQSACADGHEPVLHGYYHLRQNQTSDGPIKRLVTRSYTAGEGEFYDLDKDSARQLLERGREDLRACGVEPVGFIAPAWLLGTEAESAAREAGFAYTTRISTVVDFLASRTFPSRSQVWSVRAAWRRVLSLGWNQLLEATTRHTPLTRIGIHPPDWDHPSIRSQILHLARSSATTRQSMTYNEWLIKLDAANGRELHLGMTSE